VSRDFVLHDAVLLGAQALLVALPAAGIPRWLRRWATARWALLLPVPVGAVVLAIALVPDTADALTWLALVGVPVGAALALGWAVRGARAPLALVAAPLLALAWARQDTPAGELAALALAALSCATLGRLLAGLAPLGWLKLGIVAMAVLDAILVFGQQLQEPNAVLNAAVPAPGLPQLQYAYFGPANLGYGDLFAAGVLGGVLAAEGARQWPAAVLTFALAEAFTLLFYVTDTLPATVPVAAALVVLEARRATRGRWGPRSARSARAGAAAAAGPTSSSRRAGP
jgi:hypothetical protein